MRIIHFAVVDTKNNKRVYINASERKAREHLETLEKKENYAIAYKWISL